MSFVLTVPCGTACTRCRMSERWMCASHSLTQMPALSHALRAKCAIAPRMGTASDAARFTYFALTHACHGEKASARAAVFPRRRKDGSSASYKASLHSSGQDIYIYIYTEAVPFALHRRGRRALGALSLRRR